MNNDFWVTSEVICQRISRVRKSRVKIIGKSLHEWPKNRYSRYRMYNLISYTRYFMQLSIADFATVAKGVLFWLSIVASP